MNHTSTTQQTRIPGYLWPALRDLLALVFNEQAPADRVMDGFFRSRRQLGKKDRTFLAECTYNLVRHRRLLEYVESFYTGETRTSEGHLLKLSLLWHKPQKDKTQTKLGDAAQLEIFEKWNWQKLGETDQAQNLRQAWKKAQQEWENLAHPEQKMGIYFSMPDWLIQKWLGQYGNDFTQQMIEGLKHTAPLTVRANTLKTNVTTLNAHFMAASIGEAQATQASPTGLTFKQRVHIFQTDLFKDGLFEVQDEGSQLISFLTQAQPGMKVVDGCAGGGGKTLHLAALMQNKGILYAFDTVPRRLEGLAPRARRAGVHNLRTQAIESNNDRVLKRLHHKIDVVLADVPCSGCGVFRRNPDAAWKIDPELVTKLNKIQTEIINSYSLLVAPGGRLVYSTCSLLADENEQIIEKFLVGHPQFELLDAREIFKAQNIKLELKDRYLRLFPHLNGTDGFFAAVLRLKEN